MRVRLLVAAVMVTGVAAGSSPKKPVPACRRAVIVGELNAGQSYARPIGNGLEVYLQAIASGWILRVIPTSGPTLAHDYAELATPPYQSVTPLSISTDFAFRAQDAVGWNPRRFRFATSQADFERLLEVYTRYEQAGATPPAPIQVELSSQIAQAAEGTFTIVDARLVPGMADQWKMAGAVASHFTSTAHTLVESPDGKPSVLGKLMWLKFRLELDLPGGFPAAPGMTVAPRTCSNP